MYRVEYQRLLQDPAKQTYELCCCYYCCLVVRPPNCPPSLPACLPACLFSGLAPDQQHLSHQGVALAEGTALWEYGISSDVTLDLQSSLSSDMAPPNSNQPANAELSMQEVEEAQVRFCGWIGGPGWLGCCMCAECCR